MHCKGCDVFLSDKETSRKTNMGEHLDLCEDCYSLIANDVPTTINEFASEQVRGDFRK